MGVQDEAERVAPATVAEWGSWLAEHHGQPDGVWLVRHKRASGREEFAYEAAVIEALRFGWVDSTQKTLDEQRTMLWFAPRRKNSVWTRPNKLRVAALEEADRMEAAGRAAVEAAKANGNWTIMDSVEDLIEPDDLVEAFERHSGSREHWDSFPPSARKLMLGWIVLAKRAETRAARVEKTAEQAAIGKRAQS